MIAIVIPALNPDDGLTAYCQALREKSDAPIVLVDDGSRADLKHVFDDCQRGTSGVTVLRHDVNRGKGRGLKTAFQHLLDTYPDLVGCVTADADGQHKPEDVLRTMESLRFSPNALVLGCRDFTRTDVPLRSSFGNLSIRLLFRLVTHRPFTDTQTGLRGISASFMRELLDVEGERFDFESRMLLVLGDRPLVQIPIETVYLDGNKSSHFSPVRDSFRITGIVLSAPQCRMFAAFVLASLLSWAVDQGAFSAFFRFVFRDGFPHRLFAAIACARAISLVFNYLVNRRFVFSRQNGERSGSFRRYLLLAVPILFASWGLTYAATNLWPGVRLVECLKMAADLVLFLVSYAVQKLFVFRKRV